MSSALNPATALREAARHIASYCVLPSPEHADMLALWALHTHMVDAFDATPYLCITARIKRAGKTRLAEILGGISHATEQSSALTSAAMYRIIQASKPTLIFDEAETLSGESASDRRAVLNVGYRRGAQIQRTLGSTIVKFHTFCPKIFVLIGDLYDTLRDRSIIVQLDRGTPARQYFRSEVETDALKVRVGLETVARDYAASAEHEYKAMPFLHYLPDRDAEIWAPIFALSRICNFPEDRAGLIRLAVDIATTKTEAPARFTRLVDAEADAEAEEYSIRLLADVARVFEDKKGIKIPTITILESLLKMDAAPWRKYHGGLDSMSLARLLKRRNVNPRNLRFGDRVVKGYTYADVFGSIEAENPNAVETRSK